MYLNISIKVIKLSNRNTNLGGTDFTNDTALPAVDLNDTFDKAIAWRKNYEDNTNNTHTGDTNWTTADSFTISKNGSLLTGIYVQFLLGVTGGVAGDARIKISGTNLGEYYTYGAVAQDRPSDQDSTFPFVHTAASTYDYIFRTRGVSQWVSFSTFINLELQDATTTVTFEYKTSDGAQTVSMRYIKCRVFGMNGYEEL